MIYYAFLKVPLETYMVSFRMTNRQLPTTDTHTPLSYLVYNKIKSNFIRKYKFNEIFAYSR